MTKKRLYDVIDKAEPRGQSVTYDGIPCTARTCVTRLNILTEENENLKKHIRELQRHCKRLENENIRTCSLIKEAYNNERTEMGRMILRQLLEEFK